VSSAIPFASIKGTVQDNPAILLCRIRIGNVGNSTAKWEFRQIRFGQIGQIVDCKIAVESIKQLER
jgi:hypothetical protein